VPYVLDTATTNSDYTVGIGLRQKTLPQMCGGAASVAKVPAQQLTGHDPLQDMGEENV
jgi:hypothetical protein